MKHLFILISLLFFVINNLTSQNGDCGTSTVTACNGNPSFPFTSNTSGNSWGNVQDLPTGNNISNPSTNPASTNSGCLFSGESSGGATWVIIYVASAGTLEFSLNQSGFIDWAMWPYNANSCADIAGNTLAPVRCNWNCSSTGGTGIGTPPSGASACNYEPPLNVTPGQAFIVCATNFSNVNATINMTFNGTANLSCVPVSSSNSQTICPAATATLVGNTTLSSPSFTWNPGGLTTQTIAVSPPSTTIYTLTTVGTNSLSGLDTTIVTTSTVTVRTLPTLSLTSNSYVCPGSTINLAASLGFTNYVWTGPPAYSQTTSVGIASILNANPTMAGTYTVTGKSAVGGCTVQATNTVGIVPTASITVQQFTVCQGSDVLLNASAVGASSYNWTGPLGFSSPLQNPTITAISPNQAGNYMVVASFTAGTTTCSRIAVSNVVVTPATTVALAALPDICNNDNITLNAPSGANTYLWTGPNGYSSSNQNAVVNNADIVNSGVYNLSLITNGCVNTGSVNVVVMPPLSFNSLPIGIALCETKSGILNSSGTGGSGILNYNWSPTTDLSSPTSSVTNVVGNTTTNYILTLSDGLCPMTITPTVAITVTVNPIPVITFTTTNNRGCEPFTTDLISSSSPASSSCMWTFSNGTNYPGCSSGAFTFPTRGTYGAKLVVTDINGCVDSIKNNAFVIVDPKPSPDFDWNPEEPTVLQNNVMFYDQSTVGLPMTEWFWDFGDNYVTTEFDTSYQQNPTHVYDNPNTYTASLTVKNSFGCSESVSKLVIVNNEFAMYIPNAFSPHKSDGLNDVFKVTGMGFLEETFELDIFSRGGEKVFSTKDIKEGWNGSIKGGDLGKQDVYQYRIKVNDFKNREKIFFGHINLL